MIVHMSWGTLPEKRLNFKSIVCNAVSLVRNIGSEPLKWLSASDKYVRNFKLSIDDGKDPSSRLLDKSKYLKFVRLENMPGGRLVNLLKDRSKKVSAYSNPIAVGMEPCIPNPFKLNEVAVMVPLLHVTPVH